MKQFDEFRTVEEEARAFATEHVAPYAGLIDREERIPDYVIAGLAKARLLASGLPEEFGGPIGSDQDPVAAAIAHGLLQGVQAVAVWRQALHCHDVVSVALGGQHQA